MIRRPPRSTLSSSSAASDVYKRQGDGEGVIPLGPLAGEVLIAHGHRQREPKGVEPFNDQLQHLVLGIRFDVSGRVDEGELNLHLDVSLALGEPILWDGGSPHSES
eukprot:TRINITY_DN760_c0_g1_i1.p1 TRINITY_DN760_c0_g1~~TRINITY_DN760_c0_g1_i1.p1  ORF type:complete len:106 (+),score=25.71 TRINITY_DN760_c0_g1_i1:96-413(+)